MQKYLCMSTTDLSLAFSAIANLPIVDACVVTKLVIKT